jgi:hypothetical protein
LPVLAVLQWALPTASSMDLGAGLGKGKRKGLNTSAKRRGKD